jgi:putative transposase
VHWKLIQFLCQNYEVILIPIFQTQQMANRTTRKIRSKTARQMISWSHYTFRQRLLDKIRLEFPWVEVIIVTEEYTSKTCSCCGSINNSLGGSKIFHCRHCHVIMDRDLNAARNILIKSIQEQSLNMNHRSCNTAVTLKVILLQ